MKKIIAIVTLTVLATLQGYSQTNAPGALSTNMSTPTSILAMLQSYIVDNDANYNGWESNHMTLWEAAKFANVNGTPGASSIGNALGLEVPIYKHVITLESVTEFEQLFGDVHSQSFGAAYNYNLHQIQLSAGIDVCDTFQDSAVRAVPFIEFKKASTTLYGLCPFVRWAFPIEKNPGGGALYVGMALPL